MDELYEFYSPEINENIENEQFDLEKKQLMESDKNNPLDEMEVNRS